MPVVGCMSQRQATPVTMAETAKGSRMMLRKRFSPLTFWFNNTASKKPKMMHCDI